MRSINFPFASKFRDLIKSLILRILVDLRHKKAQEIESDISSLIKRQIAEGYMDDRIKEVVLTQCLAFGDRGRRQQRINLKSCKIGCDAVVVPGAVVQSALRRKLLESRQELSRKFSKTVLERLKRCQC